MKISMLDLQAQHRSIEKELRQAVERVLGHGGFILGPEVQAFEEQIQQFLSPARALGVSSGTDALLLALTALDIGPTDEVIVPGFTFFATASTVKRVGATPVFVDIDEQTFNIDPQSIKRAITPRTRAVIPVHLYGQCADMQEIFAIAAEHNLRIIEDAAQALGASHNGKAAGSFGDIACVSFYPTKNLGAFGEAGLVATCDSKLLERCRILRNQGMEPRYVHREVGGNYRMDAIQAAILGVKLSSLSEWNARRRAHARNYDRMLANAAVTTPTVASGNDHVYHQYTIRTHDRDGLRSFLADRGVQTEIYYPIALHKQPCMAAEHERTALPVSECAAQEVLSLPIHPDLSKEQVRYVAELIRQARPLAVPSTRVPG